MIHKHALRGRHCYLTYRARRPEPDTVPSDFPRRVWKAAAMRYRAGPGPLRRRRQPAAGLCGLALALVAAAALPAASAAAAVLPATGGAAAAPGTAGPGAAGRAATVGAPADPDVIVTMFDWPWTAIAAECTNVLGPDGYGAVQISPPEEAVVLHAAGVKVYADVVLNHMTAETGGGTGDNGTTFPDAYDYPPLYSAADFHSCHTSITNWDDQSQVWNCELSGLADLD